MVEFASWPSATANQTQLPTTTDSIATSLFFFVCFFSIHLTRFLSYWNSNGYTTMAKFSILISTLKHKELERLHKFLGCFVIPRKSIEENSRRKKEREQKLKFYFLKMPNTTSRTWFILNELLPWNVKHYTLHHVQDVRLV
jgi:hypothetical protein